MAEDGRELKVSKKAHTSLLPPGYLPELDVTQECDERHASVFRQVIGILHWAIDLG